MGHTEPNGRQTLGLFRFRKHLTTCLPNFYGRRLDRQWQRSLAQCGPDTGQRRHGIGCYVHVDGICVSAFGVTDRRWDDRGWERGDGYVFGIAGSPAGVCGLAVKYRHFKGALHKGVQGIIRRSKRRKLYPRIAYDMGVRGFIS